MKSLKNHSASSNALMEKAGTLMHFDAEDVIYSQGERAESVFFITVGVVMLTVHTRNRRRAVIATLSAGSFFSEPCLNNYDHYLCTATALTRCSVIVIKQRRMARLLRAEPVVSEFFRYCLLESMLRFREGLCDLLVNSSEQRLAGALLRISDLCPDIGHAGTMPGIDQQILADMVGTTRSRINFFMNRFRKRGHISYNGNLQINRSLKAVARHK